MQPMRLLLSCHIEHLDMMHAQATPIMNERTLAETMQIQRDLEDAAAANLGHILFELSHLELNLGLCIAWFDGGVDLERQSIKYNSKGLGEKFEAVRKQLETRLIIKL